MTSGLEGTTIFWPVTVVVSVPSFSIATLGASAALAVPMSRSAAVAASKPRMKILRMSFREETLPAQESAAKQGAGTAHQANRHRVPGGDEQGRVVEAVRRIE